MMPGLKVYVRCVVDSFIIFDQKHRYPEFTNTFNTIDSERHSTVKAELTSSVSLPNKGPGGKESVCPGNVCFINVRG